MKHGVLLINLGTPNSPNSADINRYLREFLTDKRVIDIPTLLRYLLVYGLIVPFRSKQSVHAYKLIWTKQGSPLLFHSQNLMKELQKTIGSQYKVALGMRYGTPSIAQAIHDLTECDNITVLPLYPQYSSAATGSSMEEVMRIIATQAVIPSVHLIRDFYDHPDYISSQAQLIKTYFNNAEHLLFSYHGIPERQLHKSGCDEICPEACAPISADNQACYRAQCYQTSLLLAQELQLRANQYSTAFQSRLGKIPWIKPYTDERLIALAEQGVKHLAVVCPSFTADCLETLEEIGMRAKEQWLQLGGKQFILIPSLNSNEQWVRAISKIVNARKL
ncbi:ferrochelatase [Legionella fallonii]|uniref:Ferrochelatase n=1 Tax=Legionella fallonii LLAP-10 TaxID=1212491 RepID=A0A098G7W4_9GAMM|nr:ferrochelatase [Legionella fallonii]CEG58054.1 Ferrochelatase [Legionella fallonii LLAP-10]